MTDLFTDADVEAAARAMRPELWDIDRDSPYYFASEKLIEEEREMWRGNARAALAAAAPAIAECARMAERQRCAGIVRNPNRKGREWANGSLWGNIAEELAAAIHIDFAAYSLTDKRGVAPVRAVSGGYSAPDGPRPALPTTGSGVALDASDKETGK